MQCICLPENTPRNDNCIEYIVPWPRFCIINSGINAYINIGCIDVVILTFREVGERHQGDTMIIILGKRASIQIRH